MLQDMDGRDKPGEGITGARLSKYASARRRDKPGDDDLQRRRFTLIANTRVAVQP
jgi:hypothetical protein